MVVLSSIMSCFFILIIRCYQYCISALIMSNCRFYPTCSAYAILAFKNHSLFRALKLIFIRLLKCHPFHKGGCDYVPIKIKDQSED